MDKIKVFFEKYWLETVFIAIIISLLIFTCRSCINQKNEKIISRNNIIALTDSIKYYKGENDRLCAEKTLLIGDKETLEIAYSNLSDELNNMKVKNSTMALKIASLINNPQHDTTWIVSNDTTIHEMFNFNDEPYRKLSGKIDLKDKQLVMKVDTDQVYLDLTVAVEDNKVKVSSNNPYLTFEEIYGITTPEYEPSWCLVIGPGVNIGYGWGTNFNGGNCPGGLSASVGISLTFGWNIIGTGKRIKKK